jgi:hypothetical protein
MGRCWGLYSFLGGIIIHYRSHRSFSRLTLSVFGFLTAVSVKRRTLEFPRSLFSRIITPPTLSGHGVSLRRIANTLGADAVVAHLVESTDSNNLVIDFLSRFNSFCRRNYYNTPLYIDWRRKGWIGHSLVVIYPATGCYCSLQPSYRCSYFFCPSTNTTPHTYCHGSLGWMVGGGWMRREDLLVFIDLTVLYRHSTYLSPHLRPHSPCLTYCLSLSTYPLSSSSTRVKTQLERHR